MSAALQRDLTPPEHELQPPQPIIPALRQRFDLTALEASEACALAKKYRIYRRAHG